MNIRFVAKASGIRIYLKIVVVPSHSSCFFLYLFSSAKHFACKIVHTFTGLTTR